MLANFETRKYKESNIGYHQYVNMVTVVKINSITWLFLWDVAIVCVNYNYKKKLLYATQAFTVVNYLFRKNVVFFHTDISSDML